MYVYMYIQGYKEVYWSLYNRLHNETKVWFPLDWLIDCRKKKYSTWRSADGALSSLPQG